MATPKKAEKFYLDLKTGYIKAGTPTIENDKAKRYVNRFMPWTAPIPPSGRIDLAAWQQQLAKQGTQTTAELAELEEFRRWKAAQDANSTVTTKAQSATDTLPAATDPTTTKDAAAAGTGTPAIQELTAGQRMDKIISVIPGLTEDDFTKNPQNPLPILKVLTEKCGFEVESEEREMAWKTFKDQNLDWKPAAK
jgi:hypothetical protein